MSFMGSVKAQNYLQTHLQTQAIVKKEIEKYLKENTNSLVKQLKNFPYSV